MGLQHMSEAPGNGRYCLSHWWRPGEELALFFIRRRGPWNQLDRRKGLDIRGSSPKSVAFVATSRASLPVLETEVEGVLSYEPNLRVLDRTHIRIRSPRCSVSCR